MQHTSIPHPSPLSCALWPSHPNVPTLSCSLPYIYIYIYIFFFLPLAETSVTHSPHVRPRVQTAPGHLRCRLHQTQRASSAQAETAAANHVSSKAQEKMHEEEEGTGWLFFPPSHFLFHAAATATGVTATGQTTYQEKKKKTQQNTATVSNKKSCCFFFLYLAARLLRGSTSSPRLFYPLLCFNAAQSRKLVYSKRNLPPFCCSISMASDE